MKFHNWTNLDCLETILIQSSQGSREAALHFWESFCSFEQPSKERSFLSLCPKPKSWTIPSGASFFLRSLLQPVMGMLFKAFKCIWLSTRFKLCWLEQLEFITCRPQHTSYRSVLASFFVRYPCHDVLRRINSLTSSFSHPAITSWLLITKSTAEIRTHSQQCPRDVLRGHLSRNCSYHVLLNFCGLLSTCVFNMPQPLRVLNV